MKRNFDLLFGAAGSGGALWLTHINVCLGIMVATVTLAIMLIRLRKEWKHRND